MKGSGFGSHYHILRCGIIFAMVKRERPINHSSVGMVKTVCPTMLTDTLIGWGNRVATFTQGVVSGLVKDGTCPLLPVANQVS